MVFCGTLRSLFFRAHQHIEPKLFRVIEHRLLRQHYPRVTYRIFLISPDKNNVPTM